MQERARQAARITHLEEALEEKSMNMETGKSLSLDTCSQFGRCIYFQLCKVINLNC